MTGLSELLAACENDTRVFVNQGAANRLARWRQCNEEGDLIAFIQRCIRVPDNQANGWEIHIKGGVSLESIVAIHRPDLFDVADISIARQALGIK